MPSLQPDTFRFPRSQLLSCPLLATDKFSTKTLANNQSYSLFYVARSSPFIYDEQTADYAVTRNFPIPQLLLFEELPTDRELTGAFFRIVNIAVSTYPSGYLRASCPYGIFNISFGGATNFINVPPGVQFNVSFTLPTVNATVQIYMSNSSSTILYVRGDIAGPIKFAYNPSIVYFGVSSPPVYAPTAVPVSAPVYAPVSTPVYVMPPTTAPTAPSTNYPRVRFLNAAAIGSYNTLMVFDSYNNSIFNITTNYMSSHEYLYQGPGWYNFELLYDNISPREHFYLQAGESRTFFSNTRWGLAAVFDRPNFSLIPGKSYVQVVNLVDEMLDVTLNLSDDSYHESLDNGWILWWKGTVGGWSNLNVVDNMTMISQYTNFYVPTGSAITIFIIETSEGFSLLTDEQSLPLPEGSLCSNGFMESTGLCNCFSGYYTDNSSPYKCTLSAPSYCPRYNQTDSLSNDYIPWWNNAYVSGDRLYFSFSSDLVSGRRTLIELPNSQCNYLNQPVYYQKHNSGCTDVIDVQIPYIDCGFTKVSTPYEDFYKGTIHVKSIDQVTVGGMTTERVIDTPFPISIRMPKQLAVESYVQVFGPPSLAIDAAFVGQTVSTDTQSGNLQYVSAVQYPLQINAIELVDLPYGVYGWVELVNVNCSNVGPCIQRLEAHINTTNCQISGTYRMVVSLSCRSDQGCPDEAKNGTQAFIESRIVSQSLCGEVGVDIDLNGYIQAYTDNTFSSSALAFYPGQSAYFVINAYSSRVSLSSVTLESVYYYGPNINFQYLFFNGNQTDIAASNNFVSGSMGTNQAWFGVDVSVSTPQSSENTLFKLYQGQNGVYNFVAVVDVGWVITNSPSSSVTPVGPSNQPTSSGAPFAFKKRMALQGSVSNQGSQFTAQVQIAGPTPSSQQVPQPQPQQTPVSLSKPDTQPTVSSGVSLLVSLPAFLVLVTSAS